MFCPKCRAEYREGFTECVDCLVPLVDQLDEPEPSPPVPPLELVTVFKSADPALTLLAKSLLDAASIPFLTRGEMIQDLIGWGRFPSGINLATGLVELQINIEDLERAKALLRDLVDDE
ncbi:MAG TPA: hypothetical protein VMU02_05260 [bacterium]|nr:hypothetical protein [bacterium]